MRWNAKQQLEKNEQKGIFLQFKAGHIQSVWYRNYADNFILNKGVPICKLVLVLVLISKALAKPIFVVFYWPILD